MMIESWIGSQYDDETGEALFFVRVMFWCLMRGLCLGVIHSKGKGTPPRWGFLQFVNIVYTFHGRVLLVESSSRNE
jgi:hypothetical protein